MSEILDYANRIKELKERIRTSINNKGISVSTDVPLSEYSAKISLIEESDPIWARNDLTGEIAEGDKVWVSPLSKTSELIYKWYSTTQFNNYTYLYLTPYKGYDTLMGDCNNNCVLYNFDQTNNTLNKVDGTAFGYSNTNLFMIMVSDNVVLYSASNLQSSSTLYIQTATSYLTTCMRHDLLPFGWAYNGSTHALSKWDMDTGIIDWSTVYGNMTNQTVFPNGNYLLYINKNGDTILNITSSTKYRKWVKNNETQEFEYKGEVNYNSDVDLHYYVIKGVTSDEKYLMLEFYSNANYKKTFKIIELVDNGSNFGNIFNDLNIEIDSHTYWYPSTQMLISTYNGVIRLWKYDSINGFVEQSLDFGGLTFSANKPATLNFDASVICINDNTNGVYLYSLVEQSENNYKVIPFIRQNFNKNSVTGFLTGQKNDLDNTVEVRTLTV